MHTVDMIKRTSCKPKDQNLGASGSDTTREPSKGVKLRFECDHIAPSGFGVADQEGTDSYVLIGSNTTHV